GFEPARAKTPLPITGTLLTLPEPPVLVLHVLPGWARGDLQDNRIYVRLLNASGEKRTATVGSGLLKIEAAHDCDIFGTAGNALNVKNGAVSIELAPRRVVVVRLDIAETR